MDVEDHNGSTPLFYAVTLGHNECTSLLLSYGANTNHKDKKGRTPAHCAAARGQLEALKILAKNKANLWLPNIRGDICLHDAVHSGRKDLVRWLLARNASKVNFPNNDGKCPLHVAAISGNVEMCKVSRSCKIQECFTMFFTFSGFVGSQSSSQCYHAKFQRPPDDSFRCSNVSG